MSEITFTQAIENLAQLNADYEDGPNYKQVPPSETGHFWRIELPLTPDEWCDICMASGEENPALWDGSLEPVRGIMLRAFANDGQIEARDFEDLAARIIDFERSQNGQFGFEKLHVSLEEAMDDALGGGLLDPWDRIALVWHVVKEHLVPPGQDTDKINGR